MSNRVQFYEFCQGSKMKMFLFTEISEGTKVTTIQLTDLGKFLPVSCDPERLCAAPFIMQGVSVRTEDNNLKLRSCF